MAIGGPNDRQASISAGLAAQPLVTSADPNVVGPEAVQQLVDAYRQGFVTNQDILDRVGEVGQAKKKALVEQLREYVDPSVIESRMAQAKQTAAQANLGVEQAKADQGLVAPKTALLQTQIAGNQASAVYGAGGLDTYSKAGQFFGEALPPNPTEDDFKKAAKRGNEMAGQLALTDSWFKQITPVGDREIQDANGNKFVTKVNWAGVNVTPPDPASGYPGSPAYWNYAGQLDKILPKYHPLRGQLFLQPTSSDGTGASPTHPGVPTVSPTALVSPNAPASAPAPASSLVSPASAPVAAHAAPTIGVPTAPGPGQFNTPQSIAENLQKQQSYDLWEKQKKFAQSFDSTVARVNKISPADQKSGKVPMNTLDIALAESIIKLYDPGMAIREFKWDKLVDAQPYLERLPNWKPEFLKSGALTPEGRNRLIAMGYDNIDGADESVKPHIEQAAFRAQKAGIDPAVVLNSDERRILQGVPFGKARPPSLGAAASPAAANGAAPAPKNVVVFKSGPYAGRPMVPNGDGSYSPAQ